MNYEYLYPAECYSIRGALFEVHRNLGLGFTEDVYQKSLEIELGAMNIPFHSQKAIQVVYKGISLDKTFFADIICYDKIILELKSVKSLLPEHEAQLINYLRISNLKLGLLVNFNSHPKLEIIYNINPHAKP